MDSLSKLLTEKLIILGGKAYPKEGQVVLMAGGSAAGKGTIINYLLGVEGNVLDVDNFKKFALKSKTLQNTIKKKYDIDISKMELNNPVHTSNLHRIINHDLNLPDKKNTALYAAIAGYREKPNLIFDITLKDLGDLSTISSDVVKFGYSRENIHIVWVINELRTSLGLNKSRNNRTVPDEIVINTHSGVSMTMKQIVQMGNALDKYMDGDIVFVFNKLSVDTQKAVSPYGGSYMVKSDYFYVKRKNQPVNSEVLTQEIKNKITEYIPAIRW